MSNEVHDIVHFHRREADKLETPPPGMTKEQLDYFTLQTHRAVRKATRRDRATNRIAYAILTVGLLVALYIPSHDADKSRRSIVESGTAVAVQACNRDFVDRQNFRATIERLNEAAKKSHNLTGQAFYKAVLAVNPPIDCRESEDLLTDDPNAVVPSIPPYYPGADYAPLLPQLSDG